MITVPETAIYGYQTALTRRLLAWSLFSMIAGVAMQVGGLRLRAAGMQFIGWGAVDAAIALVGQRQSRKSLEAPDVKSSVAMRAETTRLRRLLLLNTALDVLYMAGGLLLIRKRGANDARWKGHGLGILIQGGFLFFFDLLHAIPLRENGRTVE